MTWLYIFPFALLYLVQNVDPGYILYYHRQPVVRACFCRLWSSCPLCHFRRIVLLSFFVVVACMALAKDIWTPVVALWIPSISGYQVLLGILLVASPFLVLSTMYSLRVLCYISELYALSFAVEFCAIVPITQRMTGNCATCRRAWEMRLWHFQSLCWTFFQVSMSCTYNRHWSNQPVTESMEWLESLPVYVFSSRIWLDYVDTSIAEVIQRVTYCWISITEEYSSWDESALDFSWYLPWQLSCCPVVTPFWNLLRPCTQMGPVPTVPTVRRRDKQTILHLMDREGTCWWFTKEHRCYHR